jgi:hypothetical protein
MSKYAPLTAHLKSLSPASAHYPMTFAEIERILGWKLPASAYRHRAWWSNNATNSAMTAAWLEAGWQSSSVDMEGKKLVFRRIRPPSGGRAPGSLLQGPKGPDSVTVTGLTAAAMGGLATRARLAGRTAAEVAADILNAHAPLSMAERLAIADRLRGEGPALDHLDIPAMIRKDRERA